MTGPPPTAERPRGNPNHPVAREIEQQWHKLCALAMFKLGVTSLEITTEDIHPFFASEQASIVVHPFIRAWTAHRIRLGLNSANDAEIAEALACADAMEAER